MNFPCLLFEWHDAHGDTEHIMKTGLPCVDSGAAIALPGIIVAFVIHKDVLVGVSCNDEPVVLIVQGLNIVVVQ